MSTQSPMPPTPKGPRNTRRPKRNSTPYMQKSALFTTPPSSPPKNISSAGATSDYSNNVNVFKKKNPRSGKKPQPRDVINNGHRYASSHSNMNTPQQAKNGYYAGPTFHASPAAKDLPMPTTFLSKSVPASDPPPAVDSDNDPVDIGPDLVSTPSKPKARSPHNEHERITVDFLFKTARESRTCKDQSSQDISTPLSQRKAESPAGGIFQLDMDDSELRSPVNGDTLGSSYRNSMNELRSASSPSRPAEYRNEGPPRAKSDALLKTLLSNSRSQPSPPSTSSLARDQASVNGNGRHLPTSNVPHFATPLRTASGPPAPASSNNLPHEQSRLTFGNDGRSPFLTTQPHDQEQSSSHYSKVGQLPEHGDTRDVLGGNFPTSPAIYRQSSLFGSPSAQQTNGSPIPRTPLPNVISPNKNPEMQRLEDELRRILKVDAASG